MTQDTIEATRYDICRDLARNGLTIEMFNPVVTMNIGTSQVTVDIRDLHMLRLIAYADSEWYPGTVLSSDLPSFIIFRNVRIRIPVMEGGKKTVKDVAGRKLQILVQQYYENVIKYFNAYQEVMQWVTNDASEEELDKFLEELISVSDNDRVTL
jgi:hypothetical protein